MKKKNTWNIRRLVNDSFGPSSKQTSVICCKLTDFKLRRYEVTFDDNINVMYMLKLFLQSKQLTWKLKEQYEIHCNLYLVQISIKKHFPFSHCWLVYVSFQFCYQFQGKKLVSVVRQFLFLSTSGKLRYNSLLNTQQLFDL